jgi:hypothetical protein
MHASKIKGRARALLLSTIFDTAAIFLGVLLWAACSSGGTAPSTAPTPDQCAVQPDASIIVNGPSEVFVSLVGPASACPTSDASLVPGMLPLELCTKLCPPTEHDGGVAWTGCGVLHVAPGSAIQLTQDAGNAAPGNYVECCWGPGCFER